MCWCCRRCWVSLTQAKVQGLSQGRLTSRGLGPLGGTSEVQSKRGNATVFESSKANAVGTPLAKPTQREELRWKNKQRTYGKPNMKTSLGGDGSTCLGGCQPATQTYVGSPPDDEQSRPPQHHPVSSCKKMLNKQQEGRRGTAPKQALASWARRTLEDETPPHTQNGNEHKG